MTDEKMLSTKFFIDNIEDIVAKKSSLSSEIRNIIKEVCNKAALNVIVKQNKDK
jgi:hypothetical protein